MFNFDCASGCCYVATDAFADNLGIYGFALYFGGMNGIIIFLTCMVAIGAAMRLVFTISTVRNHQRDMNCGIIRKIKRDLVAICNMRLALKEAIKKAGEKANPPRTVGREVYELLEREYGARADEIGRGKGTKK